MQTNTQQGWPDQVAAATAAFRAKHPNTAVKVEYQTWTDHLTNATMTAIVTKAGVLPNSTTWARPTG